MSARPPKLVRLYADPRRVRVAVRPTVGAEWVVMVSTRDGRVARAVSLATKNPRVGVLRAVALAARAGIPGVDPGLGWAYDHPQQRGARS